METVLSAEEKYRLLLEVSEAANAQLEIADAEGVALRDLTLCLLSQGEREDPSEAVLPTP